MTIGGVHDEEEHEAVADAILSALSEHGWQVVRLEEFGRVVAVSGIAYVDVLIMPEARSSANPPARNDLLFRIVESAINSQET
jgi:uncharacterized iron-regulated protein